MFRFGPVIYVVEQDRLLLGHLLQLLDNKTVIGVLPDFKIPNVPRDRCASYVYITENCFGHPIKRFN